MRAMTANDDVDDAGDGRAPNPSIDDSRSGIDREREQAVERQLHQAAHGVLGLAGEALAVDRTARPPARSPPSCAARAGTAAAPAGPDGVGDLAVEQAEVARVERDVDVGQRSVERGRRRGSRTASARLPSRSLAHPVDDLGTRSPALDERREQLRRVLEVGVHQRRPRRRAAWSRPGVERGLVPEVPGQPDDAGPGSRRSWKALIIVDAAVLAAVVDVHDLVGHPGRIEHLASAGPAARRGSPPR